jgi:hypothetical protein
MQTVEWDTFQETLLTVDESSFWDSMPIVPYHEDPHPIYIHECLVCKGGFVGREPCELFCFMCDPNQSALYK